MKRLGLIISFFLLLSSCSKEADNGPSFTDPNPDDVEIRVSNRTTHTISNFLLDSYSREVNFGVLYPSTLTSYQSFPTAYSFVGISFEVDGHDFEYKPSNYTAEDELKGDRYQLTVNELDTIHRTFSFDLVIIDN